MYLFSPYFGRLTGGFAKRFRGNSFWAPGGVTGFVGVVTGFGGGGSLVLTGGDDEFEFELDVFELELEFAALFDAALLALASFET